MEQVPKIQTDTGARRIGGEELQLAKYIDRVIAYILDIILFVILIIGWFIWVLVLWLKGSGQTPGKQIVGIMVVTEQGYPSSFWGMFMREVLIKGLLMPLLTLILLPFIDLLWPLWDKDRQALHDKVVNTFVVKVPKNTVL